MSAAFTVYLVDDDPAVLKTLSRLLSAHGYDTRTFGATQEFLDRHDPEIAGCAVLDLSMPNLDGLTLQRLFKSNGNDRPVIFLTGRGDIPKSVNAMKAGAIDFLTKPVNARDLLAAIAGA